MPGSVPGYKQADATVGIVVDGSGTLFWPEGVTVNRSYVHDCDICKDVCGIKSSRIQLQENWGKTNTVRRPVQHRHRSSFNKEDCYTLRDKMATLLFSKPHIHTENYGKKNFITILICAVCQIWAIFRAEVAAKLRTLADLNAVQKLHQSYSFEAELAQNWSL